MSMPMRSISLLNGDVAVTDDGKTGYVAAGLDKRCWVLYKARLGTDGWVAVSDSTGPYASQEKAISAAVARIIRKV